MFKELLRPYFNIYRRSNLRSKFYKETYPPSSTCIIFMVDGRIQHGGLADRLKGIISTFALCKVYNLDFKIHFSYPFTLEDYLKPSDYNWRITEQSAVSYKKSNVVTIVDLGQKGGHHIWDINKQKKQYHVYFNMDILDVINKKFSTDFKWSELFQELFKPSKELKAAVDCQKAKIGKNYIGVVFRFQQMLGDLKEGKFPVLSSEEANLLIEKCKKSLNEIHKFYNHAILLVTSDSSKFLNQVEQLSFVKTIPGKIKHMGYAEKNDRFDYSKSFIDLLVLSEADRVISVISKEMYPSDFPFIAAKIKNIPFERMKIN